MGLVSWLLLGLLAGVIARLLFKRERHGGLFVTALLGIGGATAICWVASLLGFISPKEVTFIGVALASAGASIPLAIYARHFS
ncbi:GlsB/YeaQ/YmgE family stress response membrane protein [Veronia nyctiphanis]|uniref:GlsB/YeaQ/YmgE family stress response membrane protein n=1 Tax=Veronia nyctiphanis TaxID=1278244 RepID=A0A4Q0YNU8_9GAMM|nr:GlsB/YeaQ/YmgE family stress response membrane protein [Veronia nyctiphanis]RXJ72650.1 GlsB/YeaQ/YmgE family stress response membrane protein [Veronia nyctiphanis]